MKLIPKLHYRVPSALVGLALAASSSLCLAADITYNFVSDVQGWYAADGHGTVAWDSTHGRGGNGCLKYTIVAGTDTEVDPRVDVAFDTTGYFCVEFDMMVDPSSGNAANYGNFQTVARDASWSWDSMWYGSVGGSTGVFTNWYHVKQVFTSAYGPKAHLQMQFSSGAADADIIIYIDNVVIRDGTPPNKAVLYDFAWPEECVPGNSWGAGPPVFSQDTTLLTNGSMKEVVNYGPTNSAWVDAPAELHTPTFDPAKFTYMDFDLYIDAPKGMATYGGYAVAYWYSWATIGNVNLSEANIGKWTHYSFALPSQTTLPGGIVLHPGGNNLSNTITYYLANVVLWKPATPPNLSKMVKGSGVGGVQITMDDNTSQYRTRGHRHTCRNRTLPLACARHVPGELFLHHHELPRCRNPRRFRGAHVPRQRQ